MAPKYRYRTDVYQELHELLKVERAAEDSCRGKKMDHRMWVYFIKDLVDGDLKLDALEVEIERLKKELNSLDPSTTESHVQLSAMQSELMELERRLLTNAKTTVLEVEYIVFLNGTLIVYYIL